MVWRKDSTHRFPNKLALEERQVYVKTARWTVAAIIHTEIGQ
jgi:hypothetical protein